ncbi:MAG: CbiX/SirB N-terminal domain-containing protein [Pseudomonadota bacterium]
MTSTPLTQGVLLFAHGARDPRWAGPFEAVAAHLRCHRPDWQVQLAYLEFMSPGLVEAGGELTQQGCRQVTVAPLFLGAGGHVRKDLPVLMDALKAAHPDVQWVLAPAIGEVDSVTQAMAEAVSALVVAGTP